MKIFSVVDSRPSRSSERQVIASFRSEIRAFEFAMDYALSVIKVGELEIDTQDQSTYFVEEESGEILCRVEFSDVTE